MIILSIITIITSFDLMKTFFLNNDPFANPQLTEKFFIKTPHTFTLNILNKKYDNIISAAQRNIHAYDSYFNKFNHSLLIFHFLTPNERDLRCSHEVVLRTKQTHTYTYYKFIQHHYTLNTPARHKTSPLISIYSLQVQITIFP